MSNGQVQTFTVPAGICPGGGEIRTRGDRRNPLFCLADVCRTIGLDQVGRVADRLDRDDRILSTVTDAMGREQEAWFVTESGMYLAVLRSDKPGAVPFQRWVTREVLPSIREYGCYPPPAGGTKAGTLDEVLEAAIARHVAPLLARIEELERPESLVRRMAGVERQLEQGALLSGQGGKPRRRTASRGAGRMTGRVQQAVMAALREAGPGGMTCPEIAAATGEQQSSVRVMLRRCRVSGVVARSVVGTWAMIAMTERQ